MRLLFLNHSTRFGGTYYRAMPMAEHLAAVGHNVTLLTVSPQRRWRAEWSVVNGKVFNVGGEPVVSLLETAQLLVEANGGGEFVTRTFPAERKRIDIGDYYADDSRIRAALGWSPRTPLRQGLTRTVAFYRDHLSAYL